MALWRHSRTRPILFVLAAFLLLVAGSAALGLSAPPPARSDIVLATTNSLQASGLLAVLLPDFEARTGYHVQTIAGESGGVVQMGMTGTADLLLVDAPAAKQEFRQSGAGLDRHPVLQADFVLLGPPADPAHIADRDVPAALKAIAALGATWVSRRDGSDANGFELALWQAIMGRDVQHEGWYVSTHTGMALTLAEANRRHAYTLSDRATYLALRDRLQLRVLLEHDVWLLDWYDAIRVNPLNRPQVNVSGAQALADYLVSSEGQRLIATFGLARYGQALFTAETAPAPPHLTP